jgi:hypothetical protein
VIRAAYQSIEPIVRMWKLAYFRAALRNLQRTAPCHPDLPYVVQRVNELETMR